MKSKLRSSICGSNTLEYVITFCSYIQLKEPLKEAMDELGHLLEARERQKEMVKAIVNQKDMYQRLLAQATPLPTAGDEVRSYMHIRMHTHTHARTHTRTQRFLVQF